MHWTWYWAYSAALSLKRCPRIDRLCRWLKSRKSPHREDAAFFGELWAVKDSPVLMETVSWQSWGQWQFLHPSVSCWSLRLGAQQWRLRFSFWRGRRAEERESERWWWRVPLGMLQHFALTAGRGSSVGHGPNFLEILVEVGCFGLCRLSFLLHV